MTGGEPSCKRSTGPTSPTVEHRPIWAALAIGAFGPAPSAPAQVIRSADIASARAAFVRPPREETDASEMDERTAMVSQRVVDPRQLCGGPEFPREVAGSADDVCSITIFS